MRFPCQDYVDWYSHGYWTTAYDWSRRFVWPQPLVNIYSIERQLQRKMSYGIWALPFWLISLRRDLMEPRDSLKHDNVTQWVPVTTPRRRLSGQWLDFWSVWAHVTTVMFIKWNVHLAVLSKVFLFLILSYCFSLLHTMSYKEDICLQLSFERGPWGQFHLKGMKSSSKFAGHSFHRDCISASGWSLMLLQWYWAPEAQEHPHNIHLVAFIKVWRTVCKTMHFCEPRKWTPGLQVLFPSEKKSVRFHYFKIYACEGSSQSSRKCMS